MLRSEDGPPELCAGVRDILLYKIAKYDLALMYKYDQHNLVILIVKKSCVHLSIYFSLWVLQDNKKRLSSSQEGSTIGLARTKLYL